VESYLVLEELGLVDHHPHLGRDVDGPFVLKLAFVPLRKPAPLRVNLSPEEDGGRVDHGDEPSDYIAIKRVRLSDGNVDDHRYTVLAC